MRIKQIYVTNLFGIFNHVIPLNMDERITIIYGLNGVGKTALLRIVNGILTSRFSELRSIPFEDFEIDFDDGSHIRVHKTHQLGIERQKEHQITLYFKKDSRSREQNFSLNKLEAKKISESDFKISRILEDIVPGLERISANLWRYLPTMEALSLEEVLERFSDFIPEEIRFKNNPPQWLEHIINSLHTRFIESQRLLNLSDSKSRIDRTRFTMMPSVATYANELAKNIQAKLAEYGTLAQSLDRTFPVRVVQEKALTELTDEQLRTKLTELEKKRLYLINAGLLDKDETTKFQLSEAIDDSTKRVLSVYVEDVEKKLNIFNELAQRTDLIKRIINQRFSYKQMNISKNKGFTFTCNEHSLSPTDLSSGEQHELVILYELLFKVKPNSLILIDDPELSLHVEWQVQFLKDLREIAEIANLDVLMATHSPDIINDRWDLTVELKGPQG